MKDKHIHTAIMYSNEDIETLTGQEIRFIKNLGISQISIMIKDGYKYVKKMDLTPIDRFVSSTPETMIPKGFIQSPMNIREAPEEYNTNYMAWFLIIVLIVFVGLMVYLFL